MIYKGFSYKHKNKLFYFKQLPDLEFFLEQCQKFNVTDVGISQVLQEFKLKPSPPEFIIPSSSIRDEEIEVILLEPILTINSINGYEHGIRFATKHIPDEFWTYLAKSSKDPIELYEDLEGRHI